MRKIDHLLVGSTVVFIRKPAGSWLSENEPYHVVANGGKTCHFRHPVTGGGTYDEAWAIEQAEFTVQNPLNALEGQGTAGVRSERTASALLLDVGDGEAKLRFTQ